MPSRTSGGSGVPPLPEGGGPGSVAPSGRAFRWTGSAGPAPPAEVSPVGGVTVCRPRAGAACIRAPPNSASTSVCLPGARAAAPGVTVSGAPGGSRRSNPIPCAQRTNHDTAGQGDRTIFERPPTLPVPHNAIRREPWHYMGASGPPSSCSKIVRAMVFARSWSPSRRALASDVARLATSIVRPRPLASIESAGAASTTLGSGGPGRSFLILPCTPPGRARAAVRDLDVILGP